MSTLSSSGIMVLGKKNDEVGFYATTASHQPAHRAYLEKPASSDAPGYTFFFGGDDVTAVDDALAKDRADRLAADKAVYDLQGRRVASSRPAPGLYIVNGKVMVIK